MSNVKFKVGDIVKVIKKGSYAAEKCYLQTGKITVIKEENDSQFNNLGNRYVILDLKDSQTGIWVSEIELVEDKSQQSTNQQLQTTGGRKNDSNKPDLSLIPTDALWGMAAALTYGAKKYERHNFRQGIVFSRLVAAAMRHLTAWNEGENTDSETGLSHLDHAMASLAMLKFMEKQRPECDDRYITNVNHEVNKLTEEEKLEAAKAIQERGR